MPAMSSRRRAVASLTTCRPIAVIETCVARRPAPARCGQISPLRTRMSHIRPAVEGVTASAAARSASRCGPREASTTSARGDLRQPDDERCAENLGLPYNITGLLHFLGRLPVNLIKDMFFTPARCCGR